LGGNYKTITLKNVYATHPMEYSAYFVVYRKGMKKDGKNPLPIFYGLQGPFDGCPLSSTRLSLLTEVYYAIVTFG
jgi:hypothetical protein